MKKKAAKAVAAMAVAILAIGNMAIVAQAHHGHSSRAAVQTPYCYEDGSCDVDGVCLNGTDCDGTVHHSQTTSGSWLGHHSERWHRRGYHH